MRRITTGFGLLGAIVASSLLGVPSLHAQAQSPPCASSNFFQFGENACSKARDLFRFVSPQVGVAVAGGNPLPGDAGTLGGFGKRALSLRVVGVEGWLPRNDVAIEAVVAPVDFGAARTIVPLPAVDLALGLFAGVPLGLTNVGGVDLLLGATVLPAVSRDRFDLDPKNNGLGFSYGLRVGALQESSVIPGVSISWQRRELPKTDFVYRASNDTVQATGILVKTDAFRVIASKRFALFGVAAGIGQDHIESTGNMSAIINQTVNGSPSRGTVSLTGMRESTKRNTAFVNASFSLLVFRIVGEYGWSSAGKNTTTTSNFGGHRANEGYRFGSLGITARF